MAESSSAVPSLPGLAVAAVEWLPSGAESGLVRVRGRWTDDAAREPDLPVLALRAAGAEHRFDSLPDARFSRDPSTWRGTYLVPAELVTVDPEGLWLEWPSGARSGLPPLTRGVEPPPVPAAPERPEVPDEPGGQVIDRAVLAERRARRAEAAEQAQAKVAAEALKAVEVLELRSAELERRLEEAAAQHEAPRPAEPDDRREALAAALASAAELRSRSREWQLRLRTSEVAYASDAVRLAVLESERANGATAMREALQQRTHELEAARRELSANAAELAAATQAAAAARGELENADRRFDEARAAWDRRREELEAALAAAEARAQAESVARTTLEDELDRERTEARAALEAARRSFAAELERERAQSRAALEAERGAREAAETALAEATTQPDPQRLVADLDAAAETLRRRAVPLAEPPGDEEPPTPEAGDEEPPTPEAGDEEPPAPDAEPAVEWGDPVEGEREPCVPGVEPVRQPTESDDPLPWTPPGFEPSQRDEPDEPPAPDAEPGVEWSPPPDPPAAFAPPVPSAVIVVPEPPAAPEPPPPPAAPEPPERVEPEAKPGPVIVPATKPPARGLMVGSDRRDYPLLRGAIVKLAHDDPAVAARLLAALLPAQGALLEGPLAYDLTIRECGTYGVAIAGGRASVERLDRPHSRGVAEFHLIGDAVTLAELLAGVDHRIGRFFGPVRARGRKRRLKDLRPLTGSELSLTAAARAGARLDPELVYRVLGYAVHPSWTRGHAFTIAQEITGDAPETWYLTAGDGAGVTVADTASQPPAATVSMSRDAFDRLLREETIPPGRRPFVRGDHGAVEQMRAWIRRAREG